MKSLQLVLSIPRYLACKAISPLWPAVYASRLGCLRYRADAPEPELPGTDWVKLRTIAGGICGSDVGGLRFAHRWDSCYAAFTSFPMGMGHENVCRVAATGPQADGLAIGQRVVVDPILGCEPRGIDPPCRSCQEGHPSTCERFLDGPHPPATTIGNNRWTSGSWSEFFVAHRSQIHPLDERIGDEQAVLLDPLASAVHAILRAGLPPPESRILIVGAGCMGLSVVAALRAMGARGKIVITARHASQAELAERFGADTVLRERGKTLWRRLASEFDALVVHSRFGFNRLLVGGADVTFETAGATSTTDLALKCARAQGTVAIVGLGYPRGFDWTPVWFKELTIRGCLSAGAEIYEGRRREALSIAQELAATGLVDLSPIITHRHRLEDYREAMRACIVRRRSGQVKSIFTMD